jgi:hypothetical protein
MLTARIAFHHENSVCDVGDRRITRTHSNRRRKMITKHNKTQHFEKCFPYSSPKRSLDETGPSAQAHLTLSYSIRCNSLFPLFFSGCLNSSHFVSFFRQHLHIFAKNEDPNGHIVAKSWGVSFLAPQSGRKTQTQGLKSGLQTYAMEVLPHCKVTPGVQNASREISWNAASAASLGSFEKLIQTAAKRCRFSYLKIE